MLYDVTRSIQSNLNAPSIRGHWSYCDSRFFWNSNMLTDLMNSGYHHYHCYHYHHHHHHHQYQYQYQLDCDSMWITPVTNAWLASDVLKFKQSKKEFKLLLGITTTTTIIIITNITITNTASIKTKSTTTRPSLY